MQLSDSAFFYLYLALFPLLGAGLGWLTNRLAIQMLFRPRRPWKVLGVRLQGLIPRRKEELAVRIGEIVEQELLNKHLVRKEISRIDLQPYLHDFAGRMVRERLAPRLRAFPVIGGLVNDRLLDSLHRIAVESLRSETEPMLRKVSSEVERHLAFRRIVEERVRTFEVGQLEDLVRSLARKEFQRIEWLGGIIGFAVGAAQSLLLLLAA